MKRKMLFLNFIICTLLLTGCFEKKEVAEKQGDIELKSSDADGRKADNLEEYNLINNKDESEEYYDAESVSDDLDEDDEIEIKVEKEPAKSIFFDEDENESIKDDFIDLDEKEFSDNEISDNGKLENEINPLNLEENENESIIAPIKLENQEKKEKIGTLYFEFDKYNFSNIKNKDTLDPMIYQISNAINSEKSFEILIKGHSCSFAGSYDYNMQLSCKRAETVKKIIEDSLGKAAPAKINFVGCGTDELLTGGDKEEQSVNRRAEVYLIYNN